jgi:hypothetical protein
MTTTEIDPQMEDARLFSKLSERVYHFESNGRRYTSFSDLIVPYNIGAVLIVWALTKSVIYHRLMEDHLDRELIMSLNPDSLEIRKPDLKIPYFMFKKMTTIMETWEPSNFDDVVPMFEDTVAA